MAVFTHLECLACGAHYPADRPMQLCPADGRPVTMRLSFDDDRAEHGSDPAGRFAPLDRPDLWRYASLLPLDVRREADAGHVVPIGGGWTPLDRVAPQDFNVRADIELWLKDEGRAVLPGGGNPTRSFKDRGMAMVAAMARRFGLTRLVVPTQGNAGDSLVEYARAGGLEVAVIMPRDTPSPILERVRSLAEHDEHVRLELVTGTIREAGALMREKYLPDGWFSAATFAEPGWRIEGKKTLGLEIAEQLAGADHRHGSMNRPLFVLPDVIVYPTGGGTGILGMWKAFEELAALGLVTGKMPRFVVVQSSETPPLVRAWQTGATDSAVVEAGSTLAVGLNVPGGVGHFRVLEITRQSGGVAIAIDESRIREWAESIAPGGIGPEGAACLAAIDDLHASGSILPGDRVVVVNTCGPEKYDPRYSVTSASA